MDWELLFNLAFVFAYGHYGYRFFVTARRRVAFRSGHDLHWILAFLWAVLWPVWTILWITSAFVFQQRPASLLREPSAADRAARAMDKRKEERSLAIQDWQHRAAYWYELGKQAEAEDDQALKWSVAENLTFLLETQPDGAKVKGLTKAEGQSRKERAAEHVLKHPASSVHNAVASAVQVDDTAPAFADWTAVQKSIERKATAFFGTPGHQVAKGDGAVGFCNICTRYRKRESLAMEGVCRECSDDLGMH